MRSYKVAVVGATGVVGREMLKTLSERDFPVSEVIALASSKSIGLEVPFGPLFLKVQSLDDFDFMGTDICLSSAGASVSEKFAPRAAKAGCVVIDNTSFFRMDPDIPLVVPEVNPEAIAGYTKKNIIANPNCSTIQMVVALKPLHDKAKIKRVVVSTYQAVSGAGREAMDELIAQTTAYAEKKPLVKTRFSKQIAFNVIPQIDVFMADGSTKEEWKMVVETRKILDPTIEVAATCVRVPVLVSHSESVNVEFESPLSVEDARTALKNAPGIVLIEGDFATPADYAGQDATFVSRLRKDSSVKNGISLWVVSDNLRKGAALNAVQIAEFLVRNYLK